MSQTASANVKIANRLGLHARPATMFAETAAQFESTITIQRDNGEEIDGKSVMQMLMLAATNGTELLIKADGPDAEQAVQSLCDLVKSGFDED